MSDLRSVPAKNSGAEAFDRTILFADLAGYSAMMQRDEGGTLDFIVSCSHLIEGSVRRFQGELVQVTGDGYLVLFERPDRALAFGNDLHRVVAKRQAGQEDPALFRVGIHQGTVHRVEGAIHGHAVNVAARLQQIATPGSCTISQVIRDAVAPDPEPDYRIHPLGQPALKNISEPMTLYRVSLAPAGAARDAMLRIAVLDGVSVADDGMNLALEPGNPSAALLGYLALAPGMREHQDKLARILKPDIPTEAAMHFLADCRTDLCRQIGEVFEKNLYVSNGYIGLNELHFDMDLSAYLRNIHLGEIPDRLQHDPAWPDSILSGFDGMWPLYSGWRKVTILAWRNRVLAALTGVFETFPDRSETCRAAAQAILALEPGHENASERLIRYHGATGNRPAAAAEYERLTSYLSANFGLEPSAGVTATLTGYRGSTELRAPADSAGGGSGDGPAPPRFLRVVVQPFSANDDPVGHLVGGFRRELVANLARFREWSVIDAEDLVTGVADTAPHHYDINGRLVASDAPILQLRLSERGQSRTIWSEDLQIDQEEWQALQRGVVARITAHFETYISADRIAHVLGDEQHSATSYDTWLRAEMIFARWTPEAADEAQTLLDQLTRRDPEFAPAYSSLASFHNVRHIIRPGAERDALRDRAADSNAQRAVELDPLDARNQLAVAWSAAMTGVYDRAEIHFDLANTLSPNCVGTTISCAMGYAFLGRPDRGEALVDHALRISPMLSPFQWCYIASVHFFAGRYSDALHAAAMSADRIVDNQGWIAVTLVRLGRIEEANRAFAKMIDRIRPIWAGPDAMTPEAARDWFLGAYPIREDAQGKALAEALDAAMPAI